MSQTKVGGCRLFRAVNVLILAVLGCGGSIGWAQSAPAVAESPDAVDVGTQPVVPASRSETSTRAVSVIAPRSVDDLYELQSAIRTVYDRSIAATVAIRAGAAHGCGVIVTPGGHVLTAAHVAGWPGRQLMLQLVDGRRVSARTMGMNHAADSALVQIDDPGPWPHLEVGRSDDVQLGQWCIALGFPGGYDADRKPALRVGRILAVNRQDTALLTDCTLTGGDSGGPLLNLEGQVIGVNSRIGADLAANLHVPVDEFRRQRSRYLASESWGQLGYFGIRESAAGGNGRSVVVDEAEPDSPAGRAGLRKGDLITAIENRPIKTGADLRLFERQARPGTEVLFKVQRGGAEKLIRLRVAESPTPPHSDEDAELLEAFMRRTGWRERAIDAVGKNHRLIKQAARPAVEEAKLSAVRVMAGGRQIAMGTVVRHDGLIVTKSSQLVGHENFTCRIFDGRRLPAEVVGHDLGQDLALLRVEATDLVAIEWAPDDHPTVGTWLASVTTSGDPLMMGNVSSAVSRVRRERPLLGIRMYAEHQRPEVRDVIRGSAAELAGVQAGDRILTVDQLPVNDKEELVRLIGRHLPGEPMALSVRRGDETLDFSVPLGSESDADADLSGFREFNGGELSLRRSGFDEAFRHDTPLLPNQCGGPLVDLAGNCLGINIARAERVASYAIPASLVKRSIDQMLAQSDAGLTVSAARPVVDTSNRSAGTPSRELRVESSRPAESR